jgi:carboxyl-terminal processing protease
LSTSDVTIDRSVDDVLVIRVSAFTRGVGAEVNDAVASIGDPGGVMLDLRGNAGGLLEEARQVASAFLNGGVIAAYERSGKEPKILNADIGGDIKSPLVVVVDSTTASAAEVVAGALQDRNRAVLVGERTYGKGSVQEPQLLSDGSAIELTVGRYRTPTGRYLEGVGLDPDVRIQGPDTEKRALQVLAALRTVAGPGGKG